ncbi:MAG: nuclear transport factor 2 family protein [Verrucomicrobiota bacterium]
MKPSNRTRTWIAAMILTPTSLWAAEPTDEIPGLQKASADFVIAYNNKDAKALAELFTENGEMTDLSGEDITTGRDEIQAHYEEVLTGDDVPSMAIEVASVRLVADGVAVEDGTVHFTSPGDDEPARSSTYSAVLTKDSAGAWKIASSRDLSDVTEPAGHLAELADALKGDWSGQRDDLRFDFAFGWDDSGNFMSGEMLFMKPDAEPLTTTIRFGWDGASKVISCWTFDSGGGSAQAKWSPDGEGGYSIRTEGTTAGGESMSANQHLTFENSDTFIWSVTDRLIDGEPQPDTILRVVRRAPEPGSDLDAE